MKPYRRSSSSELTVPEPGPRPGEAEDGPGGDGPEESALSTEVRNDGPTGRGGHGPRTVLKRASLQGDHLYRGRPGPEPDGREVQALVDKPVVPHFTPTAGAPIARAINILK